MDKKDFIIKHIFLAQGTKNSVESDLKKVFAVTLTWGMGRVVIAHNHPNGDPHPSFEDIQIAKDAHFLAEQFEVDLYQIIVGEPSDVNPGFFDLTKIVADPYFFEKFFVRVSDFDEELFEDAMGSVLIEEFEKMN